jgi:hypothetical protein
VKERNGSPRELGSIEVLQLASGVFRVLHTPYKGGAMASPVHVRTLTAVEAWIESLEVDEAAKTEARATLSQKGHTVIHRVPFA